MEWNQMINNNVSNGTHMRSMLDQQDTQLRMHCMNECKMLNPNTYVLASAATSTGRIHSVRRSIKVNSVCHFRFCSKIQNYHSMFLTHCSCVFLSSICVARNGSGLISVNFQL